MKTLAKALTACLLAFTSALPVDAQNTVATAVIRPSAGGKLAIAVKDSFPTGAPFNTYGVHAYGVASVLVLGSGNAAAGIMIPGVPSTIKVFDLASGNYTTVEAGKPDVVVAGGVIFPDNFAVMNCTGDTFFAAATIGVATSQAFVSGGITQTWLISATGEVKPFGGGGMPRILNLSQIQHNTSYSSTGSILPSCWSPLAGYVGY